MKCKKCKNNLIDKVTCMVTVFLRTLEGSEKIEVVVTCHHCLTRHGMFIAYEDMVVYKD